MWFIRISGRARPAALERGQQVRAARRELVDLDRDALALQDLLVEERALAARCPAAPWCRSAGTAAAGRPPCPRTRPRAGWRVPAQSAARTAGSSARIVTSRVSCARRIAPAPGAGRALRYAPCALSRPPPSSPSARRSLPPPRAARRRAPSRPDDVLALKDVGDPQLQPGRAVGRLHRARARREEGQADTDIYMVPVRGRRAAAAHLEPEGRDAPALQPGRPLPRVPLRPRGQEDAGLPARPARRRGRRSSPTTRAASPTWPGRPTRSASRWSSPTPTPTSPSRGRRTTTTEARRRPRADRDHAPPVQARRRGLPDATCAATSTSSTSRRKTSVPAHLRALRRQRARLVARRPADRLRQQPHAPTRTPTSNTDSSWWRRGAARRPRALTDRARRRRRARLEPRRHSWSPTWRAAIPKDMWYGAEPPRGGAGRRAARRAPLTAALDRNVIGAALLAATAGSSSSCSRTAATAPRARAGGGRRGRAASWPASATSQAFDVGRRARSRCWRASRTSPPRSPRSERRRRCGALTHVNDEFLAGHQARPGRALRGAERGRHRESTAS